MIVYNRRRTTHIASGGGGGYTADDYVQNGLVFQLDGIDWGNQAGHWIERKNNHDWTCYAFDPLTGTKTQSNFTISGGGVIFDGYVYFQHSVSDYSSYTSSSHTVEICADCPGSGALVTFYYINDITITKILDSSGTLIFYKASRTYSSVSQISGKVCVTTYGSGTAYVNGASSSVTTGRGYPVPPQTSNYCYIGSQYDSGMPIDLFTGTIYSIRIYNRQLSAQEVLANCYIDNERFNLGLTLPPQQNI